MHGEPTRSTDVTKQSDSSGNGCCIPEVPCSNIGQGTDCFFVIFFINNMWIEG